MFQEPLRSNLANGVTLDKLRNSHSTLLPPWISIEELFNLVISTISFLNITISELVYLLHCEDETGRWMREDTDDIKEQLYLLAVTQINRHCVKELFSRLDTSILTIDQQKQIVQVRQNSVLQVEEKIIGYICESGRRGSECYENDVKLLSQDIHNKVIGQAHSKIWFTCLASHWCGKVQEVPDYVGMLRTAGYKPGKNAPLQLWNPNEIPWVYGLVEAWSVINLKEVLKTHTAEVTYQPATHMEQPYRSTGDVPINIAQNLSMERNWRNQLKG
jgi:hypothetical protein